MRRLLTVALAVSATIMHCGIDNSAESDNTFTLKFANNGQYPVFALYLASAADTSNWGTSILTVDTLRTNEFVRIGFIPRGPEYAFSVRFDSAGTVVSLTHASMPTFPDTISAFASLTDGGWEIGHNWGLQSSEGEIDVTP